ncbi:hypothetical protein CPC08DRAFT_770709, partial [Agrocybe pediades]
MPTVSKIPPVFCFSTGINHYVAGHKDFPNLAGGVSDADNFDEFLMTDLHVPRENILSLRDETATRQGMFRGFQWLLARVMACSGNAYVIIFFSGHGAWDTACAGSMLCPSDIKKKVVAEDGRTKTIQAISSSTISKCLHKLGAAGVLKVTGRRLLHGLPADPVEPPLVSSQDLLPGSLFSRPAESGDHLLREDNFKNFTDISLTHRLAVPSQPGSQQISHCIASHMYSSVFIGYGNEGDSSFAFTTMEGGECLIVRAGSAEGIEVGCIWSIHKTNLADSKENPPLGQLEVITVDLFSSTIKVPRLPATFPFTTGSICYSKL